MVTSFPTVKNNHLLNCKNNLEFKYQFLSFIFGKNQPAIIALLQNIAFFSVLLPLSFFFIFRKNNKKRELRVIFFYLLYSLLNDLASYYFISIAFFLYDIFAIAELVFFCIFFLSTVKTLFARKIVFIILVCFILLSTADYFFIRQNRSFNSTIPGVEAIIIICMCLYYFYDQLKQANTFFIYTTHNFWIIIAFLFFLCGTFFLYLYAENMVHDKAFKNQYFIINSSFLIIRNILFSIAMGIKPDVQAKSSFPDERFNSDWDSIQSFEKVT